MALRYYKNKETGEVIRSLKKLKDASWEEILVPPNQKFMVSGNKALGTSKLKDSTAILTARSRNYARDHEIDDDILFNKMNGREEAVRQSLLNKNGTRRRKIDDI